MREHTIHKPSTFPRSCTEGHQFRSEVHSVWREDKAYQVLCVIYCQEHCLECLDVQSERLADLQMEPPDNWKAMLWSERQDILKAYERRDRDRKEEPNDRG